jgi:hypothetical protein
LLARAIFLSFSAYFLHYLNGYNINKNIFWAKIATTNFMSAQKCAPKTPQNFQDSSLFLPNRNQDVLGIHTPVESTDDDSRNKGFSIHGDTSTPSADFYRASNHFQL